MPNSVIVSLKEIMHIWEVYSMSHI